MPLNRSRTTGGDGGARGVLRGIPALSISCPGRSTGFGARVQPAAQASTAHQPGKVTNDSRMPARTIAVTTRAWVDRRPMPRPGRHACLARLALGHPPRQEAARTSGAVRRPADRHAGNGPSRLNVLQRRNKYGGIQCRLCGEGGTAGNSRLLIPDNDKRDELSRSVAQCRGAAACLEVPGRLHLRCRSRGEDAERQSTATLARAEKPCNGRLGRDKVPRMGD